MRLSVRVAIATVILAQAAGAALLSPELFVFPALTTIFFGLSALLSPQRDLRLLFQGGYPIAFPLMAIAVFLLHRHDEILVDLVAGIFVSITAAAFAAFCSAIRYRLFVH